MHKEGEGVPQDDEEAQKWYRKAAEQDDAKVLLALGKMSTEGEGIDDEAECFRKAAELGYAEAQYELGELYYYGDYVRQDYPEAAKWYRKSAEQGFAWAQYRIGVMYENEEGVPQDYVEAHMWLSLAIEYCPECGAEWDPVVDRERVQAKMTPEQIAKAQALAAEWKPKTEWVWFKQGIRGMPAPAVGTSGSTF